MVEQAAFFLIRQKVFKNVVEGFVIDELRRVILVKLGEILQHFGLHIFHERRVIPQFIEPNFQIAPVAIVIHLEIEFDVVVARTEAEAAHGKIGTAQNGLLHTAVGDVIHFAVEQLRLPDGTDGHFLPDPFSAIASHALLRQPIGQLQAIVLDLERLLVGFIRIERRDKPGFAEEKIQMLNLIEVFPECVVSVNRKIGGNDGKLGAGLDLGLEKIRDDTAMVVVPDTGVGKRIWHSRLRY